MDIDVTEPIPAVDVSKPARNVRPAMMVGGAALAVVLAAVAALVWTFSDDSKDAAKPKVIATAPAKPPAAAQAAAATGPAQPAQPEQPADPAGGLPGGLDPAAMFGGTAATGLTSNPAFSSAGSPTYGTGAGTPTTGLVKPPNVEWPALGWEDVAPAMALGLSGGDIANLVVDIGDWVYGAGLATANNSIDLFQASSSLVGDLLLYDAAIRNSSGGSSSLASLVSSATSAGVNPATVMSEAVQSVSNAAVVNPMADAASTLNMLSEAVTNMPSVQMPDVAALGSLPTMPELPSLGALPSLGSLPQMPAAELPSLGALPELPSLGSLPSLGAPPELPSLGAMPKIELPGLPAPPAIGLPSLPSPEQIGVGTALTAAVPALNMPALPSLEFLQKLPPPQLPNMGPPSFGLPRFELPRFGPPRLGLSMPSITRLLGLPF